MIVIVGDRLEWDHAIDAVDADGAANAYDLNNIGSLDYIANAYLIAKKYLRDGAGKKILNPDYHRHDEPGFKGWGGGALLDAHKQPVLQGPNDLAPGKLVSPTALGDPAFPPTCQRRYVDATRVPYISAPKIFYRATVDGGYGCKIGDIGMAVLEQKAIPFIWADVGPGLGEVSIRLAELLAVPSSPKNGGSSAIVHFTLFRGSSRGWPRDLAEMAAAAVALMAPRPADPR